MFLVFNVVPIFHKMFVFDTKLFVILKNVLGCNFGIFLANIKFYVVVTFSVALLI